MYYTYWGRNKKRKLIISEDDLPYGTQIPENLAIECTKLEKFIEWKDEHILSLNYQKLGQYIYKYFHQFESREFYNIVDFDRVLDIIHEDMAKIKPQLAKYLKRYEENKIYELSNDCKNIVNTCKKYLKSDIRESFLSEYLDVIMFDPEIKEEVRSKLSGQSKKKYICDMIAHLSNFHVFDVKYNSDDFAKALKSEISLSEDTIKRYINETKNSRNGALYTWTKNHIDGLLAKRE